MEQAQARSEIIRFPFRKSAAPGRKFGTARLTMTLPRGKTMHLLAVGRMRQEPRAAFAAVS